MNKPFLMVRDVDQIILGVMWHDDENNGPVIPQAEAPEGVSLASWDGEFKRPDYLGTFVARWVNGDVLWEDQVPWAERLEAAFAITYADIDKIYADCVGNRTEEYKDSEADARAFAATGYEGTPTVNVSSFAKRNPTGKVQSNEWAAKQIIAQADAYAMAKVAMREKRFDTQADMRECGSLAELDQVLHDWEVFILAMRKQLGLK